MSKMYLMCGLSGVGKTTYAKKFAEENNLVYLGIDDCYAEINGDECIHENQFHAWILFFEKIHSLAVAGIDCIVDTNAITHCHRRQFLDWFPEFDEHHLIFVRASEELRYANNKSRRRVIPDEAMKKMLNDFEYPAIAEMREWDSITIVRNENNQFLQPLIKTKGMTTYGTNR